MVTTLQFILSLLGPSPVLEQYSEKRTQQSQLACWFPYVFLHVGCLGIIWVGWSWIAVAVAVALYFVRMFAVTAFYHRYFSHRTFKTSRFCQFLFGVWANSAAQRGPIWWACQHRHHHRHSDDECDAHSPHQHGFYWSHIGWLTAPDNLVIHARRVPDLLSFPELRFLDRFSVLVPMVLAAALFGFGHLLEHAAPSLGTSGWQMVVWGFFVSTVVLFHATCTINSLAHLLGSRRFKTSDGSRNSLMLAILTLGEGWHNNHHRYPGTVRQGFYRWEIDPTYLGLRFMEWLGLIWELNPVPARVLAEGEQGVHGELPECKPCESP
ncbi:MAG TPA: acyl-CoA desaturase [Phycisphaerae bacterium]|nr:acyl-CoA desaturase [Phycisphaerae bacterium]